MTLTATQRAVLYAATDHPAGLASAPATLPPAPRTAVAKALLKAGLLITAEPDDAAEPALAWKLDGTQVLLTITEAGRAAVLAGTQHDLLGSPPGQPGHEMTEDDIEHELDLQQEALDAENAAAEAQKPALPRQSLREAALALLAAWDAQTALEAPVAALRAAVAKPARQSRRAAPRQPRQHTKLQTVLSLLHRPEGASVAQIMETTGWQPHTVRGFLAGLKRRSIAVTVLDRVRQVNAGKDGSKGSYTIYQVVEAV